MSADVFGVPRFSGVSTGCGIAARDPTPVCEACGEPATRQDCEGVWLCEDDYQHLIDHSLLEREPDQG